MKSDRGAGVFQSLHVRNFRLYFFGQMISQGGTWMTRVAQTLLVLEVTNGSGASVGLLAVCQYGPVLLLGPWAGAVVDRVDKRKLLIVVQSASMLQSFALALVVVAGSPSLSWIFVLSGVQGVLSTFDNPGRRSFVTELVPREQMNNAISLSTAAVTSSRVFGPALGGLVITTLGFGWCFALDGISYIAVIVGFLRMRRSEIHRPPPAEVTKGQIRAGLSYVRAHSDLRVAFLMLGVVGVFALNLQITVPLMVRTLHGSDATFTILYSVLSIGSVLGALQAARRSTVTVHRLIPVTLGFGASMALFAITPSVLAAFPLAVVVGFTSVSFMTRASSVIQLGSSPEYSGRTAALQAMIFLGSNPVGGLLMGIVYDAWGARVSVAIGAAGCGASALYAVVVLRRDAPVPRWSWRARGTASAATNDPRAADA